MEVYTETPALRDESIQIRKVIIGSKKTVSKNKTSIGGPHPYPVCTGIRLIILTSFFVLYEYYKPNHFCRGKTYL